MILPELFGVFFKIGLFTFGGGYGMIPLVQQEVLARGWMEAETLYRQMGRAFSRLGRWQIYVLTPCETFEQLYGRRADKIRKLYNGMIPCRFYQFFKPKD